LEIKKTSVIVPKIISEQKIFQQIPNQIKKRNPNVNNNKCSTFDFNFDRASFQTRSWHRKMRIVRMQHLRDAFGSG
jgi:hypothetical protein